LRDVGPPCQYHPPRRPPAPRHGAKTHAFCSTFLILKNLLPSHHQGPALTTKLLNALAALAAKPAVNATVTALQSGQADFEAAVDQLRGGPAAAKGVDTPTATDAALASVHARRQVRRGRGQVLGGVLQPGRRVLPVQHGVRAAVPGTLLGAAVTLCDRVVAAAAARVVAPGGAGRRVRLVCGPVFDGVLQPAELL